MTRTIEMSGRSAAQRKRYAAPKLAFHGGAVEQTRGINGWGVENMWLDQTCAGSGPSGSGSFCCYNRDGTICYIY